MGHFSETIEHKFLMNMKFLFFCLSHTFFYPKQNQNIIKFYHLITFRICILCYIIYTPSFAIVNFFFSGEKK